MYAPRPGLLTCRFLGIVVAALATFLMIAPSICRAQAPTATVTILHSFGDGSVANDGLSPQAGLIQGSDGDFYGTTLMGGSPDDVGSVYKISVTGVITILHGFTGDGESPYAPLVEGSDRNFYGTTDYGGSESEGTIFKMTPAGVTTILHSFSGDATNGQNPIDGLIQGTDGNFYGTTVQGGSSDEGTVFQVTPTGNFTILHSFADNLPGEDGEFPAASLIQGSDGYFYGTTVHGGATPFGTVFKMTPSGQLSIIHSFTDGSVPDDGSSPNTGLIQGSDGNFYGTTPTGGSVNDVPFIFGLGTVYEMTPSGFVTILHVFGDGSVASDGISPVASLTEGPDGGFYGITEYGGSTLGHGFYELGFGTIFRISTAGQETILHSFGDGSTTSDGSYPVANLVEGSDGNLYGTTTIGGTANEGTIFKVTLMAATTVSFLAGLQMVSLPYTYHGVNLDGILGYTGATLANWQPSNDQYAITPTAPADQIRIGQGYWVRFPQAVSITLPGAPASTAQYFDIPLAKGWNMIGDPFLATMPVANLLFNNGTETFAQASTGANPLVGPTIWSYSPSSNKYTPATSLVPKQGYWIFAYSDTDVQVPHP